MKIIASTRPNRPILHWVDAIRLNGAFVREDELIDMIGLYPNMPIFFDIPTKREKVIVSDFSFEGIIKALWERYNINYIPNIVAISKVEEEGEIPNVKPNKVCAKIESWRGVNNLQNFINKVDMVCIDRADLIDEVGVYKYHGLEKLIITMAKDAGKEIAVASQVLPSLIMGQKPSIPEIVQLHYYKNLGVDYLVLAEETAVGFYPYQAVDIIRRVSGE